MDAIRDQLQEEARPLDSRIPLEKAPHNHVYETYAEVDTVILKEVIGRLIEYFFIVPPHFSVTFSGHNEPLVMGEGYVFSFKVSDHRSMLHVTVHKSGIRLPGAAPLVKGLVFVYY